MGAMPELIALPVCLDTAKRVAVLLAIWGHSVGSRWRGGKHCDTYWRNSRG